MVVVESIYEGELHCVVRHGPSSAELSTDAPRDNQGRGETFSPTDLVATALGTCMLTTMGIVAARHGWDLKGGRARVEKHMVADPHRRIQKLVAELVLPETLSPEARELLEKVALGCPVNRSLNPGTDVSVRFAYQGIAESR